MSCTYDNIEAFGNGKLEKQARLVSARNMISKLRQINIGIVNETLATGVKADVNPHKKPIVQQFKMFKSAGTLSSSFVAASTAEPAISGTSSCKVNERLEADKKEIDKFQAYIEGKIADPSDELPKEPDASFVETKPVTEPKIVFKRPSGDPQTENVDIEPASKKNKVSNLVSGSINKDDGESESWNPGNYGYGNTNYGYYNGRGVGRGR